MWHDYSILNKTEYKIIYTNRHYKTHGISCLSHAIIKLLILIVASLFSLIIKQFNEYPTPEIVTRTLDSNYLSHLLVMHQWKFMQLNIHDKKW